MRLLLITGVLAIMLGVGTTLLGLVPITLGTATSYYVCPIWARSLLDCARVAGPSVPAQLAFTLLLVSPNSHNALSRLGIVLTALGIVAVTAFLKHRQKVETLGRASCDPQTRVYS